MLTLKKGGDKKITDSCYKEYLTKDVITMLLSEATAIIEFLEIVDADHVQMGRQPGSGIPKYDPSTRTYFVKDLQEILDTVQVVKRIRKKYRR